MHESHAFRELRADHQGTDQPRANGHGHVIKPVGGNARASQRFVIQVIDFFEVRATGDLRHDAAKAGMRVDLRKDHVRERSATVGDDRHRGFIARTFDAQPQNHAGDSREFIFGFNKRKKLF